MAKLPVDEEIMRVKISMQRSNPAFAYLLSCMNFTPDGGVDKMRLSRDGTVRYNTEWLRGAVDKEESKGVKTAMLTALVGYITKAARRPPSTDGGPWTMAAHMKAVNSLRVDPELSGETSWDGVMDSPFNPYGDKWDMPPSMAPLRKDKKFSGVRDLDGKHMLELAKILEKNIDFSEGGGGGGQGEKGSGPPMELDMEPAGEREEREMEEELVKNMAKAVYFGKSAGNLPGVLSKNMEELVNVGVPWEVYVRKFVSNNIQSDYTYAKPHKKSALLGVYLPSMTGEEVSMVVHMDSSGSTWEELDKFMAEINGLLSSFGKLSVDLLVGDTGLRAHHVLTEADFMDTSRLNVSGGGGTTHKWVVDWVLEHRPDCAMLVSLTDGYSDIETTYPELPLSCDRLVLLIGSSVRDTPEMRVQAEVFRVE